MPEMSRQDRGFSLVELMVAMTVTLIVSAAIYGLLTSGSNAFRREPELSDRQQNIRVAMDLVARDVFNAGASLPTFSQVFTFADPPGVGCTGAEGLNGCGVMGTLGPTAQSARGDTSQQTDVLEMVSTDEQCLGLQLCPTDPPNTGLTTAATFVTREPVPGCMRLPGFALLSDDTYFWLQPARVGSPVSGGCTAASAPRNGYFALTVLPEPFRVPANLPSLSSTYLYSGRVVRYRIAPATGVDPDPTLPALWRSETGRYTAAGVAVPEPGEGSFPQPDSPWEIVARGIEDLQVEYMDGSNLWRNQAPVSTKDDWSSLVRQVRITLSARASAANLQGQTTAVGAPAAVRGQLSTTVTPRQAFNELQMAGKIQ